MTEPLWRPDRQRIAAAQLTRFRECLAARRGLQLADYETLHRWSVESNADFWSELRQFADVRGEFPAGAPAIEHPDRMPGARFFPAARLSFAENLLHYRDEQPAIVACDERGARRVLSFRALHEEVARIAAGLRTAGVAPGDRVAGFLPNLPEAVIAMLATASIGAIWSSCSPDFGIAGVLERFGQIQPKVLFTADGYRYAGRSHDSLAAIAGVLEQLPSVERVVVVANLVARPELAALHRGAIAFDAFGHAGATLALPRFPFDQPLYVLYSSGTTGAPKCIVHGAGGVLLQHRKEHLLHLDLRRGDRLFYYTTCGWMMWNWLASALATGATIVLYDGSPFHPDPGVLWRMAEAERVTHFGTSPRYLAGLEQAGWKPRELWDLAALRVLACTGSPLGPTQYDYVYRDVKTDLHLAVFSGGTELCAALASADPTAPVWRGEMQGAALGMAVAIVDDHGRPVPRGARGELTCRRPFPSMPVGFWNDADGARYRAAYFQRFPGTWHHGDYAENTEHGGIVIHGRSDAVLNPGGVRIGTAEIYRSVETQPEVLEALCIAQQWQGDVRVVLFLRLRDGLVLDEPLRERIRAAIRRDATPRHVPAKILAVPELPRTISGKLVELAVREVVHGRPVANLDALANPQALEHFRNLPELAS
ncbi:MAG: acetoacetate--CoA ligase [Steroidobacteraceae bacterium]